MRARLKLLAYISIYWLLFFSSTRLIFILYNQPLRAKLTGVEIIKSMAYGIWMDCSMTGYVVMLTGLLFVCEVALPDRWLSKILVSIHMVVLLLFTTIFILDIELYRHWGFRLNTAPFFYISKEAVQSVHIESLLVLVVIFTLVLTTFIFIYFKVIACRLRLLEKARRRALPVLFAVTVAMIIPIRGSFTVAPMNTGFVYFHRHKTFANHAAINVVWNFFYSLKKGSNVVYPENLMDKTEAVTRFSSLYQQPDTTYHFWRGKQPNILLIVLESFTADIVEPLGGLPDVTPNLNALCKEGILFTNVYASGDRTDKGLVSILSGYPAQTQASIIKFPEKTQDLPHVSHHLRGLHYQTSFVYGGDVDFANFRSYLSNGEFDHLTSVDDFDDDLNTSKWGVHDHIVFDQALKELDTTHFPFFKVILTLSSHEPFDVPHTSQWNERDERSLFLNACHYTDSSLGGFIEACKAKSWWANTVVIITADHGHRFPNNHSINSRERFKIPLLFIGGPVTKDTVIHTLASQTDIANTLLGQLDRQSSEFNFSKNIMGYPLTPFAAYYFNDGYGFLLNNRYIVYDNIGKQFITTINAEEEDLLLSKAYQQVLFSDFNQR